MKSISKIVIVLLLSLCLFSCGKKEGEKVSKTEAPVTTVQEPKIELPKVYYEPGVIIYTGWVMYEERDDGKMYAVQEANAGEKINYVLDSSKEIQQKVATRHLSNGKEEDFNFVKISYEDTEYWTRDIFIADKKAPTSALVLKEDYIYSGADILNLTKSKITEGAFVALYKDSTAEFVHAQMYNGTPFGKEIYLKRDCVESDVTTIEMIRTLGKLNKDTLPEVADEVLMSLLNDWKICSVDTKVSEAGYNYFLNFVRDLLKDNIQVPVSEEVMEELNSKLP